MTKMLTSFYSSFVLGLFFSIVLISGVSADYSDIKSFSVGDDHTLFIKTDGSLWAYGHNDQGQLGISSIANKAIPVKVGDNYKLVSAGTKHTLAIKDDGSLWAWGYHLFGQIGNGLGLSQPGYITYPVAVDASSKYIAISAGQYYSLGIKDDNSLWAWGYNQFSKLGDGTIDTHYVPVKIGDNYKAVAAGHEHSLAIKTDDSLWAWGHNTQGEIGDGGTFGSNVIQSTPVKIGDGFKAIAAGGYNSLAIKSDGSLWAWGSEDDGKLGLGEDPNNPGYPATSNQTIPVNIPVSGNFVAIDIGDSHSVALQDNGDIWAWGNNPFGELGIGVANNDNDPATLAGHANRFSPVLIGHNYIAIGAGVFNTVAIKKNIGIDATGKVMSVNAQGSVVEVDKYSLSYGIYDPFGNMLPAILYLLLN